MIEFISSSFALLALLFAILVITSKNLVISIVYLVGVFMFISLILILLGIKFIGLSYIIVYIGAISVLFLFIIMMLNIRMIELGENDNKFRYVPFSVLFLVLLFLKIFFFKEIYCFLVF